jgi:hypothetical protein
MAGRGQGQGNGRGQSRGHGPGDMQRPEPTDEARMRPEDVLDEAEPADVSLGRGRSADSPGHRKQAAGAKSARDFAPGRSRKA